MDFVGAQQTCFSDWGRTVVELFPDAKFRKDGTRVSVFHDGQDVGYYDFGDGTGKLADGYHPQHPLSVGRFPSFSDINIDDFIQQ